MVDDRLGHGEPACAQSFRDVTPGMSAPHMQHRSGRFILLDAFNQRIGVTPCGCRLQTCGNGGPGGCVTNSVTGKGLGPVGRDIGHNTIGRGEDQGPDAVEAWQTRIKHDLHQGRNADVQAITECNRQQLRHPVR